MTQPLLTVNQLSIKDQSNQHLVQQVSFSLQAGETLGIVGASGSGKSLTATSVIRLLPNGLTVAPESRVHWGPLDLTETNELTMRCIRGRQIGMVFQEALAALNPVYTVGEQINEVLKCHFRLSRHERQQQVEQLLEEVGLSPPASYRTTYAHQLSGGQRQRALIAAALAGDPALLIADEPTTALDVTTQARILKLLKRLQSERQMAMIFITHDLNLVNNLADHVLVMQHGRVVERADTNKVMDRPEHPYTQSLLASSLRHQTAVSAKQRVTTSSQPLLALESVGVAFPVRSGILQRIKRWTHAVIDAHFQLDDGQTLALVGESGSGKTSLARAIMALIPYQNGSIRFQGHDITRLSGRSLKHYRSQVQIIFQDPYTSLNPRMMVHDIIAEGMLTLKNRPQSESMSQRVDKLLTQVGLSPADKWRYPHAFSGGQRQRIAIARALAIEPKLLICDEPTSKLDWTTQLAIIRLLQSLQEQYHMSYLLISHDLRLVQMLADRVVVMRDGEILEQNATLDIFQQPEHAYTQQLIEASLNPL